MPVYEIQLQPEALVLHGPCLPVKMSLPQFMINSLNQEERAIPSPIEGTALVDTAPTKSVRGIRITTLGIILALKNLGTWLASWKIMNIEIEPMSFLWGLLVYALINVPTDLYIANHLPRQRETI